MQFARALAVVVSLLFLLSACDSGSGYSTDEAEERCDLELSPSCPDETAREKCVTCYESCGPDCFALEKCPVHYVCYGE